jgi:hypothetical protein
LKCLPFSEYAKVAWELQVAGTAGNHDALYGLSGTHPAPIVPGSGEAQGPDFGPGAAEAALPAIDRELQSFSPVKFLPSKL